VPHHYRDRSVQSGNGGATEWKRRRHRTETEAPQNGNGGATQQKRRRHRTETEAPHSRNREAAPEDTIWLIVGCLELLGDFSLSSILMSDVRALLHKLMQVPRA